MKYLIAFTFLLITFSSYAQYDEDKIKTALRLNTDRFNGEKFGSFNGTGLGGKFYSNDSLQNKITIVSFWFSACVPCINEFEDLKKLYSKYNSSKKFQLLSFTFDSENESSKTKQAYNLSYPIISLSDSICTKLSFGKGYPTNIILNKSGKIAILFTGSNIYLEKDYFANKIYPLMDSMLVKLDN